MNQPTVSVVFPGAGGGLQQEGEGSGGGGGGGGRGGPMATSSDTAPRVVVVGAGFAGFHAARGLSRRLAGAAEIVVVDPQLRVADQPGVQLGLVRAPSVTLDTTPSR